MLQVGDVIEGTVASLQPYGAFVALGENMNGLLHISQISHDRISSVEQVLQPGMKLKVCALLLSPTIVCPPPGVIVAVLATAQ